MEAEGTPGCRSCGAQLLEGEIFCTGCGARTDAGPVLAPAVIQAPPPQPAASDRRPDRGHIGSARKWLLAIAILTLGSGFFFYFVQKEATEKEITQAEVQTAHLDPVERDRMFKENIGMTFAEAVAQDRGKVNLMLAINIAISAIYFGLWFWAKRNALPAALVALLLFVTVTVVNAVVEPTSIYQGLIVKVFFIVALSRAISAANQERKLATT